jgi:hypothetical protein
MTNPMKTTYAFHNRVTGHIELCDGDGNTIDNLSSDALVPDMVEVCDSVDPTDTRMRPYAALHRDTQDSIIYDHLECYCEGLGYRLVELNHE